MQTEHIVLTISIAAAAALTQKRFVTTAGAVPAAGAWCPGVTNAGYDAGEQAGVDVQGVILVEAGAAIAADAEVQTDATGCAITKAAGASLGRALDAASAAGEWIRILR
jgi:hypothetical protein